MLRLWTLLFLCLLVWIAPSRAQLTVVPLTARELLYDPQAKLIYATVGSKGGELANSIVLLEPNSGRIVKSVPTSSEPGAFTLSAQGRFLYVAVGDSKQIRRYELPSFTAGPTFPFAEGSIAAALYPSDTPESVVAVRYHGGPNATIVYDNEKPRRLGHAPVSSLRLGLHPLLLYGTDGGGDLAGLLLTDRGTAIRYSQGGMPGGGPQRSANGLIFYGDGSVLDPETRQVVGKFPELSGAICPDPETGTVYTISGEKNDFTFTRYDLATYRKLDSIPLSRVGASDRAENLIVCGTDSLAFRAGDRVVLMKGVRHPKVAPVDLEVTRSELPKRLPRDGRWSYTLTVTNKGTTKASGVSLSDTLEGENIVSTVKASQGTGLSTPNQVRADIGTLAAGASATVTVELATRDAVAFGATAVVRALEPESNVLNNVQRLESGLGQLPDLSPQFELIQQGSVGAGVNLQTVLAASVIVRNNGRSDSPPCIARFYYSDEPRLIVEFAPLLQDVAVPAIKAGESVRIQLRAPLGNGGDLTGSFLHVIIDPTDRVREEVKSNNTASGRIR